jgi:molybdopterin molybdotransferase
MIDFSQALEILRAQSLPLPGESVPLVAASGRFLCEGVASPVDSPPFDKSAIDGYAVPDSKASGEYRILETIAAGSLPSRELEPGSCIRIMTGAMIPTGTRQVVRGEYTVEEAGLMRVLTSEPYENIIRAGTNLKKGVEFLPAKRLGPREIGSLASCGISRVMARRPLRAGVFSTGSELKEPGELLLPGEIHNSNTHQLMAQLEGAGAGAQNYGTLPDIRAVIEKAAAAALGECDLLFISGGVSAGEFDYVPAVLEKLGVETIFHGVRIKPGKPVLFGRLGESGTDQCRFVFALPGNPVSAFVLFEILVKPFLYHLNGVRFRPPELKGRLTSEIRRRDTERLEFLPVRFMEKDLLQPVPYSGSAHMSAMAEADGLVCMEAGQELIEAGVPVTIRLLQ